ncbi:hypothetical protein DFH08DRAFT_809153 [Mycena albidolilacea]|uniref:Uncharacterized protein n=1 Tax=Mycena albidolilacea TaxID=1033008 RepID=A0AAD7A132_9AGAR|nr:hypothetical protein DFH08DRAFT_809153 [Mycena albidolilacea]
MPELPIEIAEKPATINCLPGTGASGGNYASPAATLNGNHIVPIIPLPPPLRGLPLAPVPSSFSLACLGYSSALHPPTQHVYGGRSLSVLLYLRCACAYALGRKSNKSGPHYPAALKLHLGHLTATLVGLRASEPLDSTLGFAIVVAASPPRSALLAFLATTYASGDGERTSNGAETPQSTAGMPVKRTTFKRWVPGLGHP